MKRVLLSLKFYPMRDALLSGELRQRGLLPSAVAFSRRWATFARRCGCFETVHDFTVYLQDQQRRPGDDTQIIERLQRWEEIYGMPTIAGFIAADRTIRSFEWRRQLRVLDGLFTFLERIMEDEAPEAVIGELSSAPDLILWSMAQKLGVKYLCPVHSRIWADRIAFSDLEGQWEGLAEAYQHAQANGLSVEDEGRAKEFLSRFLQERPSPSYMSYVAARSSLRKFGQRLRRLPDKLLTYGVDRRFAVDYSVRFLPKLRNDTLSLLRRALAKCRLAQVFDEPHPDERFILFPLHFQPEASTMVYAPFYENQLAAVENMAKCLPAGYRLYVKEHKAMWGRRPLSFYRALQRVSAVRLIAPPHDIHNLIELCDAVVVLTGTTGLEALFRGKPVAVLGKVFYELFDGAARATSFDELALLLRTLVRQGGVERVGDLNAIHSLLSCTYPGNLDSAQPGGRTLAEENVRTLADVLIHRASQQGHIHD